MQAPPSYKALVVKFDPAYRDMLKAIDVVKQLIRDKQCVLYGGTAIDYALRLRGDSIYPDDMLAVPDLDFYSPDNVADSYALADQLFAMGYEKTRSINAQHMETMRVDLMNNHWIADITYRPAAIFARLPYLEYDGMRVIHPDFQRIDVHSSLAFPYDNPPREVIFARWDKDIERFNKLAAAYPIDIADIGPPLRTIELPLTASRYVLTGFAAYAALYQQFVREMTALGKPVPDDVIAAKFDYNGVITTDAEHLEIIHFDIAKAASELAGAEQRATVRYFEPYINLIPERAELTNPRATVFSTEGRLTAVSSFGDEDSRLRITSVQYLLRHMLSMHHATTMGWDGATGPSAHLSRYVSLLRMINHIEAAGGLAGSMFAPSVTTYGADNVSLAQLIALDRIETDITGKPGYKLPQNYTPARAGGRPPPKFSPDDIVFFQESGREIKAPLYEKKQTEDTAAP